ncbi:ABC transporter substrate-binding protein [Campylobacter avium]|uniref:ABC transporter substrate-binding protein n=1 Tax=Campylobacter avium TaxID=522485 RepID=UPI00255B53A8|nr:helical backbone metal receptor [Campylobacter avium]
MKKFFILLILVASSLFAKERLVVLDPASIEIIYLLGAGDEIVGIASLQHSNIYPEQETKKLTSVGTFSNPSLEKIVALKPSLVILSSYSINLEERLKQLGIKTLFLKAQELKDLKSNVDKIAKLLGREKEAKQVLDKFDKEIEELKKEPLDKSAIYLFSSNPLMAFSDNSLVADILRILGIKNLTVKSEIQRPIISSEFILKQDPDMIILGITVEDSKELIKQNQVLQNTKAYKNGHIFSYDKTHSLLRLSPTMVDRIKEFKQVLKSNLQ